MEKKSKRMKIIGLVIAFPFLVMISCKKGNNPKLQSLNLIKGNWELYLVFGGNSLGGNLPPKTVGGTILSFNLDGTYILKNPSNQFVGIPKSPGTFSFSLKGAQNIPNDAKLGNTVFNKDSLYHETYLQQDTLILDSDKPALDGLAFKFVRIK